MKSSWSWLAVAAAALLLSASAAEKPDPRIRALDKRIQRTVKSFPATVSIYAKNLDTGLAYSLRATDKVRTASTIKLAVMAEVFGAVEEGRARWSDRVELREDDKVSGSGVVREMSAGLEIPVRDLVHLMIVVSDNTATNLLLDKFGADAVNQRMSALGLANTRVMRKIRGDGNQLKPAEGWSEEGRKPENQKYGIGVTTPLDMVTFLEKLDKGDVISADSSRQMIEILKRQQYTEGIGRRLGNGVKLASKSGSLDALRSDVGIVYSPGGKIAMAITVDGMKQTDYSVDNAGSRLIADLAPILVAGLHR